MDSLNKASRDEVYILNQIFKSKYVRTLIMMIIILYNIYSKMHLTQFFFSYVSLCAVFLLICIIIIAYTLHILIVKLPKYLLSIFLALNAFFIHICYVKAVQDDISAKCVPIRLHDTVVLYILCYSV